MSESSLLIVVDDHSSVRLLVDVASRPVIALSARLALERYGERLECGDPLLEPMTHAARSGVPEQYR